MIDTRCGLGLNRRREDVLSSAPAGLAGAFSMRCSPTDEVAQILRGSVTRYFFMAPSRRIA